MTPNSSNDNEINVWCDWLTDNGHEQLADEIRFEEVYLLDWDWENSFPLYGIYSVGSIAHNHTISVDAFGIGRRVGSGSGTRVGNGNGRNVNWRRIGVGVSPSPYGYIGGGDVGIGGS